MQEEYIIFDLDHTLYDYNLPHKQAQEVAFTAFGKRYDLSIEAVKTIYLKARKSTHIRLLGQAASHNRLMYFQGMVELVGGNALQQAKTFYDLYWDTFLEQMQLFDGVLPFLSELKKEGKKLCILTDLTAHIQFRKLKKTGLDQWFDFLVTSEEVGHEKPHPMMFKTAMEKMGGHPTHTLMIGDNWDKDILGAANLQVKSIWINHKGIEKTLPEGVTAVSNFAELINAWKWK